MIEDLHTASVTVKLLCDTVEVSKSGYYAWAKRPTSERATENAALLARIQAIHDVSVGDHANTRRN